MWIKFNPNPMARNVGDCVIRAICAALNVDWETAFEMTATNAYQMADMQSSNAVLASVLRQNGFYRRAIPDSCPDCYSAREFCEDHPYGIYVLGFGDHVATVIDGDIYDSWDSSNEIPQYYFFRKDV